MNTLVSEKSISLPFGLINPSSVLVHEGRLLIGGRTAPAWLATLKLGTLGDFRWTRFPADNHPNSGQAKYNVVLQMMPWGADALVLFSGSSQLTIAQVHPEVLSWADVISTTRGNDILSFWTDGVVIYVSGFGQDVTIGSNVISLFQPPSQDMTEWIVQDTISQYTPIVGVGGFLYHVTGLISTGVMMASRFNLLDGSRTTNLTTGVKWPGSGPDMVSYGDYLYMSFLSSFFGSEVGVPIDTMFRVHKSSLKAERWTIEGPPVGAVWDFWADNKYLWLLRTGTLTRYDGTEFVHYSLGDERPELLVGDNQGHLFGVERGNPIIVRRYAIPTDNPVPAFIVTGDSSSVTLSDGKNQWLVAGKKLN